jgi:CheY-like chemotaxis protein
MADATVLVADDDPNVLRLLEAALTLYGFKVLAAPGGAEAVELLHGHPDVGVALVDVRMPGMDGPRTLAALRAIDPGLPCLFMTGQSGDYTAAELLAFGADGVLEKPFRTLGEVVRALRQAARP